MERREIGIGDGELCSSLFGVVVAASLELGVEMKAGYIIVVVSSSSSSLAMVVANLCSCLFLASSSFSFTSSSNFLLLPSGILFLPRRPGFLPSRLPAPCLLSSLPRVGRSRPTGSLPRPTSTLKPALRLCSIGCTFLLSWLLNAVLASSNFCFSFPATRFGEDPFPWRSFILLRRLLSVETLVRCLILARWRRSAKDSMFTLLSSRRSSPPPCWS